MVESLIKHGISDPSTVVDYIFESDQAEMDLLDTLVNEWRSLTEFDPVTVAMARGHSRLEELLKSQWGVAFQSRTEENFWTHPLQHDGASPALLAGLGARPNHFISELGFSIGLSIAEGSQELSVELIQEYLNDFNIEVHGIADALLPIVELWASLRTFALYQERSWEHPTELVGLRAKIASIASNDPRLWAQSLRWILARSRAFDHLAEDVTLALATVASEVRQTLETACSDENESIRLKSRGVWTLLNGLEGPDSEFGRTLADAAARYMDGSPLFPHPLDPLSATWLGSLGVEQAIKDGIHRATSRFAAEVPDQGGDIEEALTKSLIKEIEVEFRQIRPRLELIGSKSRSVAPALIVQQRPISKSIEEPVYGCDLAWIVNATVDGRLQGDWVELIQVKKSILLQKHGAKLRTDSWRIESKQLTDILQWSASAVYWLIASAGEVLVIPAKYLLAIQNGRAKKASVEKFTVGYHEARTVAVPLHQYLVDLLIGQWVGTSSEDVVRFARGENSTIRPRAVIEVTITISLSKEKQ